MSSRWPGGLIRKTPVTPAGPLQNGAAPGVWSLADAAYWVNQGLWPTAGNFLAVEDVFSTYLYTGNGSTQTITNGIDLAGKGGLVIQKERSSAYNDGWFWADTVRGANNILKSQNANGQITSANTISAFSSTGFTAGSNISFSGSTYASWTFRKAPKFFDVVTYTGNSANRTISHSLGVAPGAIIVKRTDTTADWQVYHRSNANTEYMVLNSTAAKATGTTRWNSTTPTATEFTVGTDTTVNASGATYVAYLFAHDATADGIIQCGSFTTDGSGRATISLGWEPQWVLIKQSDATSNWFTFDTMRGMSVAGNSLSLAPDAAAAEANQGAGTVYPTATGFVLGPGFVNPSGTFVYIAIRRGPMKTPTVGTSVFAPITYAGNSTAGTVRTTGIVTDMVWSRARANVNNEASYDRLRGAARRIETTTTSAETTEAATAIGLSGFDRMDGYVAGADQGSASINFSGRNHVNWSFRRAPGFFDVVCYTGTGVARTVNHNLGVAPELMIVKSRSAAGSWRTYDATDGNTKYMELQDTRSPIPNSTNWNNTSPTSSVFTLGTNANVNASGTTYVAYLFASCPGVSKVCSYTGNGSSQTINCGFSNGSRFFLVKRTDSAGDWWVYDSARGIVAAADPALALNSTAAEVTSADAVDTDSTGIIVNQETTCNINVNGGTYIYLAIA